MRKFTIRIEVRDSNRRIILDSNGTKRIDFTYDVEMLESNMENNLKYISKTFQAWMPNNHITIEASVLNSISGTYMPMYWYDVNEDKFVKL